jgi:hypothetical protein
MSDETGRAAGRALGLCKHRIFRLERRDGRPVLVCINCPKVVQ